MNASATPSPLSESYRRFLDAYDAKLPADLPDAERRRLLLAYLDSMKAQHAGQILDQLDKELEEATTEALHGADVAAHAQHAESQLAQVRAGLGQ